ncbi:MAG: class I SAM-dependent methyltransferase [Solirubrobacterales bacterium]
MSSAGKNWDQYVINAEEVARTSGFRALRDRIVATSKDLESPVVADIGSGTGLLTLALAGGAQKVWAIDISERMADYLRAKSSSAGFSNVETVVASAVSLPLVDGSVDIVVSNYCYHHLSDDDKQRAISEAYRVLRPGGRFVFGDMMFSVSVVDARDRELLVSKIRSIASRGVPGIVRIVKNFVLYVVGRWEKPARSDWWASALVAAGFADVRVEPLEHEGGFAVAIRPSDSDRVYRPLRDCGEIEIVERVAARG